MPRLSLRLRRALSLLHSPHGSIEPSPPLWMAVGTPALGVLTVTLLTQHLLGKPQLLASMGASCVLFFYGSVPPRILTFWITHLTAAAIGYFCALMIPDPALSAACAIALIQFFMRLLRAPHAPAGATTLLALFTSQLGCSFPQFLLTLSLNLCSITISFTLFKQLKNYLQKSSN